MGASRSVRDFAAESGLELDEVLVRLWDAGLTEIARPEDRIPARQCKAARKAVGLATPRELKSIEYWCRQFRMDPPDFVALASELGIRLPERARRLPKGAIARFRREARVRGLFPEPAPKREPPRQEPPPYVPWRLVGRESEIHHLSADDVLRVHTALVSEFAEHSDPIEPAGVKSRDLFESAVARPRTCLGDEVKYPTIEMAGAALLHSLTQNHAFHNENKRTALVALLVLLERHGVMPTCKDEDLFRLVLQVAQHSIGNVLAVNRSDSETLAIADWLYENTRAVDKTERPLPWRKLRAILNSFGCTLENAGGNRMDIMRMVRRRGILMDREVVLKKQVFYGDDGREAHKNTISAIRHALELDEDHGVDSQQFYGHDPWSPGDFIVRYRKILRRLSHL
jgi:death-on-curing family protein